MPPNYQFENVVCYIYLQTLLTIVEIYANSVAASTLFDKVGLLAFKTFQSILYSNKENKHSLHVGAL